MIDNKHRASLNSLLCYYFKDQEDNEALQQLVAELLKDHGAALVNGLIRACLFSLPTYMIPESADVLYELLQANRPVSETQCRS